MKYIILFVSFLGLTSCSFGNNFGEDYTKKPTINSSTGGLQTSDSGASNSENISDDSSGNNKEDVEFENIQKDIDAIFSDIENGGK